MGDIACLSAFDGAMVIFDRLSGQRLYFHGLGALVKLDRQTQVSRMSQAVSATWKI
jgi:hypothetical protein